LFSFLKDFDVSPSLYERLERYDLEAIRQELDKRFFESLRGWAQKLSEVEFKVDERRKLEIIIGLINRFVFVQTLDDYAVVGFRWIKSTWDHAEQRWYAKGKLRVLEEFFREVQQWFYEYYDTELFRDDVLQYIERSDNNIELFYRNIGLVLGLVYWQMPLGGFKGIMQYKFKFINEDIFGKAYETFLAEVRRDQGIYYTPRYITEYIVDQTVGAIIGDTLNQVEKALQDEDFGVADELVARFTNTKVVDPACGSGSFLIKAFRRMFQGYSDLDNLLKDAMGKYRKFNGTLSRPGEVEDKEEMLGKIRSRVNAANKRELISKVLIRHIYGNDLDVKANEVAKVNLWLEAIKLAPTEFRFDTLPSGTNHILPDLEVNLGSGDSLYGLSLETVLDQLHADYANDLQKLSELRNEYIEHPTRTELVEEMSRIKLEINKALSKILERQAVGGPARSIQSEPTVPFFWPLEFWFAFFDDRGQLISDETRGFDVIVGNPPYYTETRGYKDKFRLYTRSPLVGRYYEPKMDVFYFFIELGLDLLRPSGRMGLLIMQYWNSRGSGKLLREKIANEATVTGVVNFSEFKVFDDAKGQHNSVLLLAKQKPVGTSYPVTAVEVVNPSTPKEEVAVALLKGRFNNNVTQNELKVTYEASTGRMIFLSESYMNILEKMKSRSDYRIAAATISQGVVLPQDKVTAEHIGKSPSLREGEGVFLLSEEEVSSMALTKKEKSLLRPFFRARQVDSFYYEDVPAGWLVYSEKRYIDYDQVDVNKRSRLEGKTRDTVQSEILEEIHRKYPSITAHLDRFYDIITSDRKPYGIHRSRHREQFLSDRKVVSVRKTQYPKFSWIPVPYFMDESACYIEPDATVDPRYMVSLLNSSPLWFWFRYGAQKTHGTQLQIDLEIIKDAPLIRPPGGQVESQLIELSQAAHALKTARQTYLAFWRTTAAQMMTNSVPLSEILQDDVGRLRRGNPENCWTTGVTFHVDESESSPGDEYEYFVIEVAEDKKSITLHGLDYEGRLSTAYVMAFTQKDLMAHVYCALLASDALRNRSLSQLLQNTKIPVVQPNTAEGTINIMKRVTRDFESYLAETKFEAPP
jgi:hypothetical protein